MESKWITSCIIFAIIIIIIYCACRWCRKRGKEINRAFIREEDRQLQNRNNEDGERFWVFTVERGNDQHLINYSNNNRTNRSERHHCNQNQQITDTHRDVPPSYEEAVYNRQPITGNQNI